MSAGFIGLGADIGASGSDLARLFDALGCNDGFAPDGVLSETANLSNGEETLTNSLKGRGKDCYTSFD